MAKLRVYVVEKSITDALMANGRCKTPTRLMEESVKHGWKVYVVDITALLYRPAKKRAKLKKET